VQLLLPVTTAAAISMICSFQPLQDTLTAHTQQLL